MPVNAIALLCLMVYRPGDPASARRAVHPLYLQRLCMVLVAGSALWIGVTRMRIEAIGRFCFYEDPPIYPVGRINEFFTRLECGERLALILRQMQEALARANAALGRQPKVFFGPRMGWGYAAFNLPPPAHLPYSWWAGVDYPASDLPGMLETFQKAKFDYCFFVYAHKAADTIYMPEELIAIIRRDYQPCVSTKALVVLQRKPGI